MVPGEPRFGSEVWASGATGNAPRATAPSIEELVFWLLSPNASRASNATTTATTMPGIMKRRMADLG